MSPPTSPSQESSPGQQPEGGGSLADDQAISNGLKIISYAVNSRGQYELQPNFFWQPVGVVNDQAWREIAKKIAASQNKIAAGRASCLRYYMIANQMDSGLVSRYTGIPRWRVLLHLLPPVFNRLSGATLKKYAELYRVSPDDLRRGRLLAPIYQTGSLK